MTHVQDNDPLLMIAVEEIPRGEGEPAIQPGDPIKPESFEAALALVDAGQAVFANGGDVDGPDSRNGVPIEDEEAEG